MASLRIIIVNYRTAGLTIDCLCSLAPEVLTLSDCRVVVVEGGSGDDSAERLAAAIHDKGWSGWVELVPLVENRGFAAGNNAAIKPILNTEQMPDFILLLNPDTVIRPGAIHALIDFMREYATVGIAGSRLEHPDGTSQRSAFRFPGLASEFEGGMRLGLVSKLLHRQIVAPPVREESHSTDWVAGACMIIRRDVFKAIGLLDEEFFLYYEETDFCLRAHRAGWKCWYVPSSRVVHFVGQSSGLTNPKQMPKRMPGYWFESRRRYFEKNYGGFYACLASASWLLGFVLWQIHSSIRGKPKQSPENILKDFIRYNFLRPFADRSRA